MNAGERQRTALTAFHLSRLDVLPAYESQVVIELEVALRLPLADDKHRLSGLVDGL